MTSAPPGPTRTLADRFDVLEEVGSGGMGVVHRGLDRRTGQTVALKFLSDPTVSDRSERFRQEARILAALDHPAIVRFLDFGVAPDGALFLAMEWLEGIDLCARLDQGVLSMSEAARVGRLIAEALAAAHDAGVVHRDLKPHNVFLEGGRIDRVKLIDFGIAIADDQYGALTKTGVTIGTLEYMAPEQARGERPLGPAVDLHALGAVLFECVTGASPFAGPSASSILATLLFSEAPRLRDRAPHTPPELDQLVAELLAKEPARRPPSAASVVERLLGIELVGSLRPSSVLAAISVDEQRLVTLVAVCPRGTAMAKSAETIELVAPGAAPSADIPSAARQSGAELMSAPGRGYVLAFVGEAPLAGARAAARAALDLTRSDPTLRVSITSGPSRTKSGIGGALVDEALELAVVPGVVRLNPVARHLLADTHDIVTAGAGDHELRGVERRDERLSARLVGRDREVGAILGALEGTVSDRAPQCVLVVALPGMGKSHLLRELMARFEAQPSPVASVRARAEEVRRETPYATLSELVRRLHAVSPAASASEQASRLEAAIASLLPADRVRRAVAVLSLLLGLRPSGDLHSDVAALDPVRLEEALELTVAEVLRAATARTAVALVIDDAHWADAATLKLVGRASKLLEDAPLFVLLAARPEISEVTPPALRDAITQTLKLGPLPKRAAHELASAVVGSRTSPDEIERIIARAEGNPLFLQQLVAARLEDPTSSELPPNVLASVEARLLRLDPSAGKILRAASVYGGVFWDAGVTALLGERAAESARLGEWLVHLVVADILTPARTTRFHGCAELSFAHPLVREAAYAMLPPHERTEGHRLAARWLEGAGEKDPLVLARHFEAAAERREAAAAYASAAQIALSSNDLERAVAHAERAAQIGVADPERGKLALIIAEAKMWGGRLEEAELSSSEAVELAEPGSGAWIDAVSVRASTRARVTSEEVVADIELLLDAVSSSDSLYPRPSCIYQLVSASLRLGRRDLARRVLDVLGVAAVERSRSPMAAVYVLMGRSWEATYEGDFAAGVAYDLETLDRTLLSGDTRQIILARVYVGHDWMMLGAYERARGELELAAAEAHAAKLTSLEQGARHNLAMTLHRLGEVDRGLAMQRVRRVGQGAGQRAARAASPSIPRDPARGAGRARPGRDRDRRPVQRRQRGVGARRRARPQGSAGARAGAAQRGARPRGASARDVRVAEERRGGRGRDPPARRRDAGRDRRAGARA